AAGLINYVAHILEFASPLYVFNREVVSLNTAVRHPTRLRDELAKLLKIADPANRADLLKLLTNTSVRLDEYQAGAGVYLAANPLRYLLFVHPLVGGAIYLVLFDALGTDPLALIDKLIPWQKGLAVWNPQFVISVGPPTFTVKQGVAFLLDQI